VALYSQALFSAGVFVPAGGQLEALQLHFPSPLLTEEEVAEKAKAAAEKAEKEKAGGKKRKKRKGAAEKAAEKAQAAGGADGAAGGDAAGAGEGGEASAKQPPPLAITVSGANLVERIPKLPNAQTVREYVKQVGGCPPSLSLSEAGGRYPARRRHTARLLVGLGLGLGLHGGGTQRA
jgi:hypothetical protein